MVIHQNLELKKETLGVKTTNNQLTVLNRPLARVDGIMGKY